MPYNIVKTDGTQLVIVPDNTVVSNYSVSFVGQGALNYGQTFNKNFLTLLENSAKTSQPSTTSLTGQLWYNRTAPGTLNVYDGTKYKPLGYFYYSNAVASPSTGDVWYDTANSQLKVYNGSTWTVLTPTPLPIAGTGAGGVLGGIKVGSGLSIDGSGLLSATSSAYTLPTASTTVLGGVKVDGTTVTINGSGVISAVASYTLPIAGVGSGGVLGGIKVGTGLAINAGTGVLSTNLAASDLPIATASALGAVKIDTSSGLAIAADGTLSNTVTAYSLPIATASTLGGIKVGTGLTIDPATGVLSSNASAYSLPIATASTLGGVIIDTNSGLSISSTGLLTAKAAAIPIAGVGTGGTLGGVRVGDGLSVAANGLLSIKTGTGVTVNGSGELVSTPGATGVTGYTGSVGATGVTGFQGSQGVTGFTGSVGFIGSIGFTGSIGVTGFQGSQGLPGLPGVSLPGATGITGFTGSVGGRGATGVTGYTGSQGATGVQGATGLGGQGATGVTGYTGSVGATGVTGYQGSGGTPGATGVTGYTGSVGATGVTGYQGSQGIGYTGSAGAIGVTGYTGSVGATGVTGATGSVATPAVTSVNGRTGAVVISSGIASDVTGSAGAMRAWGMFNGTAAAFGLGKSAFTTGYSVWGVSSVAYNSVGAYTITLASPPGIQAKPIAFAQALNASSGIANVSTYSYRAVAFNDTSLNPNLVKVTVTNNANSNTTADSVQFMIIWT